MTNAGYRWVLLVVVLGYAALALAVTDLHRFLAYDEAIYLSQVYPGPALPFTAPRARGLPLMLVPLGWFEAPVPVIRGYLLAVEAGLMYLGFNAWLPVLRGRAVIAAAVFGAGWLPLFYATEVFPNLPVAFGAVAATGYLARYLGGVSGRRALVACAVAVALVALVRPTEAVFVTLGLGVMATTRPGRELALRWGLPVLGLVAGWLPWLIEAQVRFGGPLSRLRAASSNVGGGFHPSNVRQQLSLTDGPVSGSLHGAVPWLGILWWSLLAVSAAVLIGRVLTGRADQSQRAAAVAAAGGIATATQYLFLTQVQEARFLLPPYAVLTVALIAAVPSPAGLRRWFARDRSIDRSRWIGPSAARWAGRSASALLVTAMAVTAAVFAGWQITAATRVEAQQVVARTLSETLADVVRRQGTAPCAVAGEVGFPVIAFGAGCRGAPFHPDSPDITVLVGSDRSILPPVFVLTTTNPDRTGVHPVPGSVRSLAADGAPGWWLFVAVPDEVVTVPDEVIAAS